MVLLREKKKKKEKATQSFFTLKHVETHAHPLATQNQQIQIAFLALMHLLLIIISPCHQHKHIAGFPPQLYWRQSLSLSLPLLSLAVSLSQPPSFNPPFSPRLPLELKANYSPQIHSNISLHHSLINSARARKIKFILNSIKGKLSVLCGFPYTFGRLGFLQFSPPLLCLIFQLAIRTCFGTRVQHLCWQRFLEWRDQTHATILSHTCTHASAHTLTHYCQCHPSPLHGIAKEIIFHQLWLAFCSHTEQQSGVLRISTGYTNNSTSYQVANTLCFL